MRMDNGEIPRGREGRTGGMANPGYQRYLELLDKMDRFLASVRARYGDQILCQEACTDCCRASLSLWPVEAYHLAQGLKSMPGGLVRSLQIQASRAGASVCPLLLDARCAAYAFRPILCRTYGFPFLSQEEGDSKMPLVSYCERNFRGLKAGDRLQGAYILDLDALNSVLAVVNLLFLAELPGKPTAEVIRIPISEVVAEWDLWQSRLALDG